MSGTPEVGGREDWLPRLNNTFTCQTAIMSRGTFCTCLQKRSEVLLLLRKLQSCFREGSWLVTSLGNTNARKEFTTNYTVVAMISASSRRYALQLLTGSKTGNPTISACRSLQAAIMFAGWNSLKRVNTVKATMTEERDILTSCFCDGIKWAFSTQVRGFKPAGPMS